MNCPHCKRPIDVSGPAPGARVSCASCGRESLVPSRDARKVLRLVVGLGVAAMVCPCLGAVALSLPGYSRFSERARQSECQGNLKSWYVMQRTHQRGYALPVDTVGFHIERGNRYAYFSGPGPIEDRSGPEAQHGADAVGYGVDLFKHTRADPLTFEQLPPEVAASVGIRGPQCPMGPDCSVALACIGNIDRDDTLDVWTVSTVDRVAPDGERYEAGEPMPHVNDDKQ